MVVLKLKDKIKYKGKTFTFEWVNSDKKGGAVVTLTEGGRKPIRIPHHTVEKGLKEGTMVIHG